MDQCLLDLLLYQELPKPSTSQVQLHPMYLVSFLSSLVVSVSRLTSYPRAEHGVKEKQIPHWAIQNKILDYHNVIITTYQFNLLNRILIYSLIHLAITNLTTNIKKMLLAYIVEKTTSDSYLISRNSQMLLWIGQQRCFVILNILKYKIF